jgi:hypothetical protein
MALTNEQHKQVMLAELKRREQGKPPLVPRRKDREARRNQKRGKNR